VAGARRRDRESDRRAVAAAHPARRDRRRAREQRAVAALEAFGFRDFDVGKNAHGAAQVALRDADDAWPAELRRRLAPLLPDATFAINRRLRCYRYDGTRRETFRPHVDNSFPALETVLSDDDDDDDAAPELVDSATHRGRFSALLYLNADFDGGETVFYEPLSKSSASSKLTPLTAVVPQTGSVLVFPQAGEPDTRDAWSTWPTHEGAPVTRGVKYVIRTDLVFREREDDDAAEFARAVRWHGGHVATDAFAATAVRELYSPYMGVENAAVLLYALCRFVKARRVLEVGAGFTSLWLLRALRDNDRELGALRRAFPTPVDEEENRTASSSPRFLGWPWLVDGALDDDDDDENRPPAKLFCVDDCAHGAQTADKVEAAARAAGLDAYLAPLIRADALDPGFAPPEALDLAWLDFGAGDRLDALLRDVVLPALRLGGLVCLHSTLTNQATRDWLEGLRRGSSHPLVADFGLEHVSFLEPHKRFQNSITVLQKRRHGTDVFEEPIWSLRP